MKTDDIDSTEDGLTIRSIRVYSGVAIVGLGITLRFIPNADGLISVNVIAHPALTHFRDSCTMGQYGAEREFDLEDIRLDGDSLECMRTDDRVPVFREGFRVALEPGMSDQVARLLPIVYRVAVVAAAIERRYAKIIGDTPYQHMISFFSEVVAAIVLDDDDEATAFAKIKADHWAGNHEELMAPFEDQEIKDLLATAGLAAVVATPRRVA